MAPSPMYRTIPMFTRTGAQCAVCSSWRMPCDSCRREAEAGVGGITEAQVLGSIGVADEDITRVQADAVVLSGATVDRVERARRQLGLVE